MAVRSDHGHWPAEGKRSKYPHHWVLWYGHRKFVFFTPKVGLRSLMIEVTPLPFRYRRGLWVGFWAGRGDDDEMEVTASVGLLEVAVYVQEWIR